MISNDDNNGGRGIHIRNNTPLPNDPFISDVILIAAVGDPLTETSGPFHQASFRNFHPSEPSFAFQSTLGLAGRVRFAQENVFI